MNYEDLTPEEQALLGQAERWLRGMLSSFYSMLDDADFPLKQAFWTANIVPILAQLDNGDVIPNTSGLAGAVDVTVGNINAVYSWISSVNGDMDTNLALVEKFIGVNAS